jgi:hypothetical protein
MFMTPREIKSQFAPLEADKHEVFEADGERMETDQELYGRKLDEAKMSVADRYEHDGGSEFKGPDIETLYDNIQGTGPRRLPGEGTTEHDERYNEWADSRVDSAVNRFNNYANTSLYDHMKTNPMPGTIHLGHEANQTWAGDPDPSQSPKQVVGGHHRLSVQFDQNPDQLIPVTHHVNLRTAQNRTASDGRTLLQSANKAPIPNEDYT